MKQGNNNERTVDRHPSRCVPDWWHPDLWQWDPGDIPDWSTADIPDWSNDTPDWSAHPRKIRVNTVAAPHIIGGNRRTHGRQTAI
jgi:hypothetical protein